MKQGTRIILFAGLTALGMAFATPGQPKGAGTAIAGLKPDRVVLLMRHGVRPPTKNPPMPAGVAAQGWPGWSVNPGWLTERGGRAVTLLGAWDGSQLRANGVLPRTGCPAAGMVKVVADSDQRTIATADKWIAGLASGCAIRNEHKPQDEADPIFGAIEAGLGTIDVARANAEIEAGVGAGGIAAVEARHRALLMKLDTILCGKPGGTCGVSREPSTIIAAKANQRPKLGGALDRASTAAQILLLEYADGKPMVDVGWGKATADDVAAFAAFHALEFRILARPPHVASANLAGILPIIREGLEAPGGAAVTMISGHDTNIANLGGLLDVHWSVPGLATDDPAPGGAIILERLTDSKGEHFVRAFYRSQTVPQIRGLTPLTATSKPYLGTLLMPGCMARGVPGLCTMAQFQSVLARGQ